MSGGAPASPRGSATTGRRGIESQLRAVVLLVAGACAGASDPLPAAAEALGVEIRGSAAPDAYRVSLAGASVDLVAGAPIEATTTTVRQAAADGPALQITADRSSWDLKNHRAHFTDNVVVTRGDVILRCAALEVTYAGATTIDTVVATGGVVVERGERRAEADRAELTGRNGKIVLTGKPRLSEGVNALAGERITLWLDDEKADCEGGSGGPCTLVVAGSALGH